MRLSKAKKDLDPSSLHPTLGLEATLPQHRTSTKHNFSTPQQDDYPVWYFFYGTLADPVVLARLLSLRDIDAPNLVPARVLGGRIQTLAGKYNALVDGNDGDVVYGSAYLVTTKEREENLQYYETEKYDIVRCSIMTMNGKLIPSLTFRLHKHSCS